MNQIQKSYKSNYFSSLHIILVSLLTGIIAENVYHLAVAESPYWIRIAGPLVVITLSILMYRHHLYKRLGTRVFFYCIILVIALFTLWGISGFRPGQIITPFQNPERGLRSILGLDDIFGSWAYLSLYILLGADILKRIKDKSFIWRHSAAHISYLGGLLVILGFISNFLFGWRGQIPIEPDNLLTKVQVLEGSTSQIRGILELPFSIRLDDYSIMEETSPYFIQVLENAPPVNPHESLPSPDSGGEVLEKFHLEKDKIHRIENSNFYFRLIEFFPNFGFRYDYPTKIDTIAPMDPGIMANLIIGSERSQLQLRANQSNILEDPHLDATLEFYWQLPEEIKGLPHMDGSSKSYPDLQRIIFVGQTEEVYYVFNAGITREKLVRGKEYTIPGNKNLGFSYQFIFPDAKFITATPSSLTNNRINPVAKLEVWSSDRDGSQFAYVYPGKNGAPGLFGIPGMNYSLGMDRDKTATYPYLNRLSVIDTEGSQIKTQEVSKYHSLKYKGYRFYNLPGTLGIDGHPGIGVWKPSGLYLVWSGLAAGLLSFVIWLYSRTRRVRKESQSVQIGT